MKRAIIGGIIFIFMTGCGKVVKQEITYPHYDAIPTSVTSIKKKESKKVRETTYKKKTVDKTTKIKKGITTSIREKNSLENKWLELKKQYPEGMSWTEENVYEWQGGIWKKGYGCAAFAFLLSDALYGKKKAEKRFDFNHIEVGDVIRILEDTHFVVVLEVHKNHLVVAEGNYNGKVHWGRKIMRADIGKEKDYILKRKDKS